MLIFGCCMIMYSLEKNLLKFACARNIKSDRIIFAEKVHRKEHLDRLKLADLVLDTRIYNGHTTTTDALKRLEYQLLRKLGNISYRGSLLAYYNHSDYMSYVAVIC